MTVSLLPSNSGLFEIALEGAVDVVDIISPAVDDLRGFKSRRPLNASIAPWIVLEMGLGEISAFFGGDLQHPTALTDLDLDTLSTLGLDQIVAIGVTTIEDLIDQGRAWQRIRGTPAAVSTALGWIGYDGISILDQVQGRTRWHLYQINMGKLPLPDEVKLLADAEHLADLSDPARSFFWRGFYGYDVRGLSWGKSKWGESIWGDASGVKLPPGKTKWSHGREHDLTCTALPTEQVALGTIYSNGDTIEWLASVIWETPGLTWNSVTDAAALNAWLILRKQVMVAYYDVLGVPIAYSPVFMAPVQRASDDGQSEIITYKVRTGFGDGFGFVAASVSLIFDAQRAAGVKPGLRWLTPDQVDLTGSTRVGNIDFDTTFQQTIRETISIDLTVTPLDVLSPGEDFISDTDGVTLTTTSATGSDEIVGPQSGLIPAGGALMSDISGTTITSGPDAAPDIIYIPQT